MKRKLLPVKSMVFTIILGIWVAAGIVIGFQVPTATDGPLVLQTTPIAFFHVPMAITMIVAFLLSAWHGVQWLRKRQPISDAASLAYAEIGTVMGVIATATGAIFARTNWGAYWSWDPQQTGVVATLLTYAALFALRVAVDDEGQAAATCGAVYAILGAISAIFWSMILRRVLPAYTSLHPKNTLVTSDWTFKFALWFNVIGYIMLLVRIVQIRTRLEMAQQALKEKLWGTF